MYSPFFYVFCHTVKIEVKGEGDTKFVYRVRRVKGQDIVTVSWKLDNAVSRSPSVPGHQTKHDQVPFG